MSARRTAGAGLLALLCALATGCGRSSDLIGPSDARALTQALSDVRSAVGDGDCATTALKLKRLRNLAGTLPGTVDRDLRKRLRDDIHAELEPRATFECGQQLTVTTPTVTTPTPTGPTQPVEPTEPSTPTAPPTTTQTTPSVPTTSVPSTPSTPSTPSVPDDPGGFGTGSDAAGGAG